jgi:hypothetical protein
MRRTRLSLEPLEARLNPVTFVLATFSAGALVVTGNDNPESVEVTQGTDDRLTLAVLGGGQIRLNGGPGQTAVTLPASVTAGAAFHLGGGADTLFLTGVDLPGPVTIDGGTGGNRVVLQGGVTVRGNLAVANGAGFDRTTLTGPVTVAGNLTIAHGAGGSLVDDDASTDLQVTGTLTVANGPGADTVSLGNAARITVGRVQVSHGPGPEVNATTLAPTVALTVGTTVRVTGGAGSDTVTLGGGRVSVGGGVTIANGAGGSSTSLDPTGGLFVGGTVGVTAAAGRDTVRVGRSGRATVVGGGVRVGVGAGGSNTAITGTRLTVGGAVRVSAGAGDDAADIHSEAGDGAVGGGVTFDLGPGDSQYAFVGATAVGTALAVGGALRVTTADDTPGSGSDQLFLTGVRVRLGTTVTTGAGRRASRTARPPG